jgi:hypothetical protein
MEASLDLTLINDHFTEFTLWLKTTLKVELQVGK